MKRSEWVQWLDDRAAESDDEKVALALMQASTSIESGETRARDIVGKTLDEANPQWTEVVRERVDIAVRTEREACAKIAEEAQRYGGFQGRSNALMIADEIRARGRNP
ncbi:MAG: hypothetical protein FWD17_19490 [Polyangiaceae bacterium]|nr:hypothetical protein [Polyangiaceae bacterium]